MNISCWAYLQGQKLFLNRRNQITRKFTFSRYINHEAVLRVTGAQPRVG